MAKILSTASSGMTGAHTKVSKPRRMAIKLEELFLRDFGKEATGELSGGTPSPAHWCLG